MKQYLIIIMWLFPLLAFNHGLSKRQQVAADAPVISFTFDDGKTADLAGYKLHDWHGRILAALDRHHTKAIMFVAGHNKKTKQGVYMLSSWNNAGHYLANHTLNHPNFNNEEITLEQYQHELLANDEVIRQYSNYVKLFRFPYLKEGNTPEKVEGFRKFLKAQGYRHGHVTIDCSDWYIDSRLRTRLTENPGADISGFKAYYIKHIYEKALFYDSLALALTGRHIHHSLLLHHNLAAALFLDDLMVYFKQQGWRIMDAREAYRDQVYQTITTTTPAGESLTWSMAKQTGRFDNILRYPAEGDQYEKAAMDSLGL